MFIYDDNFLTEEEIRNLEYVVKSYNGIWHYSPSTIHPDHLNNPSIVSNGNWSDMEYFTYSPVPDTLQQKTIEDIIQKFAQKNNISYKTVSRIKVNFTPGHTERTGNPHVDIHEPHLVFLYYLEDADGETVLYNEKFTGSKVENVTVMQKVTPKRGAAFIVDGLHFHSITPPKSGLRKVINANLTY